MQKRQRFMAEFKREAVRLLKAGDKPAAPDRTRRLGNAPGQLMSVALEGYGLLKVSGRNK